MGARCAVVRRSARRGFGAPLFRSLEPCSARAFLRSFVRSLLRRPKPHRVDGRSRIPHAARPFAADRAIPFLCVSSLARRPLAFAPSRLDRAPSLPQHEGRVELEKPTPSGPCRGAHTHTHRGPITGGGALLLTCGRVEHVSVVVRRWRRRGLRPGRGRSRATTGWREAQPFSETNAGQGRGRAVAGAF